MTVALRKSLAHWPEISHAIFVPRSPADYEKLVLLLDELIDEVGGEEQHPLASLMEVIGLLIETYEDSNVAELE